MTTETTTPAAPAPGTPAVSDGATPNATGGQPAADGTKPASEGTLATSAAPSGEALKPELNEDGTPKAAEGDKPAVPEAYTFDMPEGLELDTAAAAEFSAIAKANNLTQEQATKFTGIAIAMQQRQMEAHANTVAGWAESVKSDKDMGGDKLPATLASTRKVMDAFGTPGLKSALDSSGYGNHPEFIRFVAKIGASLSEDTFVRGGNTTDKSAGDAASMYPASNMNP